jgi:hypothetical protein
LLVSAAAHPRVPLLTKQEFVSLTQSLSADFPRDWQLQTPRSSIANCLQ